MTELTVTFPTRFRQSRFRVYQDNQVRNVRNSISGAESVVPTFAAKWRMSGRIMVRDEDERLEWAAFVADMQGGLGVCDVPIYAEYRPKDARGRELPCYNTDDFDAFEHWTFYTDTSEFVELDSDVTAGQSDISLNLIDCQGLRAGHYFSIGSRLHIVTKSWAEGSEVRCSPPLREAHVAGTAVEVANPLCRSRMIGDGNGVPTTMPRPVDFPEPSFVEAF